jgi:protein SCO1/2
MLRDVGIDQRLGQQLPLDALFADEAGKPVRLGQYFGKRPVLLVLAYYNCPMLCTQVFNGLVSSLRVLPFDAGKDFDVVAVSFDPRDRPPDAAAKKKAYVEEYRRPGASAGWHFLTGGEGSIERVTKAAGFRYRYDESTGQFAHAAAIYVATPGGKLSRYFYGIEYGPRDLRLAMVEASEGRIGSIVDQILLFCFHYDPKMGRYSAAISPSSGSAVAAVVIDLPHRDVAKDRLAGPKSKSKIKIQDRLMHQTLPLFPGRPRPWRVRWTRSRTCSRSVFFATLIALLVRLRDRYRRRSESELPRGIEGSLKLESPGR